MPSFTNAPAQADEQLMALRALKARYPYMFVRPHIGQDFYRGWLAEFIVACNAIDELLGADKRGFHFRQLKEKYGWARYYWATDQVTPLRLSLIANGGVLERQYGLDSADRVDQQICQILLAAEKSSMQKCIVCSEHAESRSFGGWRVRTCDRHGPDAMERDALFHAAHLRDAEESI